MFRRGLVSRRDARICAVYEYTVVCFLSESRISETIDTDGSKNNECATTTLNKLPPPPPPHACLCPWVCTLPTKRFVLNGVVRPPHDMYDICKYTYMNIYMHTVVG